MSRLVEIDPSDTEMGVGAEKMADLVVEMANKHKLDIDVVHEIVRSTMSLMIELGL